jgi:hypothetical protein
LQEETRPAFDGGTISSDGGVLAIGDLWNGSQRSGSFVIRNTRFTQTPLLLERSGRQAR